MRRAWTQTGIWGTLGLLAFCWLVFATAPRKTPLPAGRSEVVFWHFWGGQDRQVVDDVVARFNDSQQQYFVRAVAMPGNNLDLKLFLAVTGGEPPDLVNQDDPIVADWASRGALLPLSEVALADELQRLENWLVPAAQRLGRFEGQRFALCNGLDIRALYYNQTLLDQLGLRPPETLDELDRVAAATVVLDESGWPKRFGFLPDPRRLWAWGIVFGGQFYDPSTERVLADSPEIVAALDWMVSYRNKYGVDRIAAFRQGDQSLPGKTFPLLAGRYAMVMDGQWRVRDIRAAQQMQRQRGEPVTNYGVVSLPPPSGGQPDAGWANGNFFIIPRGAKQAGGAWEFMKFWCGFDGSQATAAEICIAGGWIPVSQQVVQQPAFQEHLAAEPLFAEFVRLAASKSQIPTPVIPGAPFFQRTIHNTASTAMYVEQAASPRELLEQATREIQTHLDRLNKHAIAKP